MAENTQNTPMQVQDDEISLKDLILKGKEMWRYLLGKWKIIVIVALLGSALGVVKSLRTKPEYQAVLTFAVQEKGSGNSGGLAALAGQFGIGIGGGGEGIFSGANLLELLKSRNLIEKALLSKINVEGKERHLLDYYIDKEKLREKNPKLVEFPLTQERESFSRAQDSTLNVLLNSITTKKLTIEKLSKESGIIAVKFSNGNEYFAQQFTKMLVSKVIDFYVQSRTELPRTNLEKMQRAADSIKREYESSLYRRAVDADRNVDAVRQVVGLSQQREQVKIQILTTTYVEMAKNIEAMKLDLMRETPFVQIIDEPISPLPMKRFGKAKGIVIGGFIGGFLIVAYLLAKLFYKNIMKDEEKPSEL